MGVEPPTSDLLAEIRQQNLGAYEKMPSRIDEDVSQESQIAEDYHGRLAFELLQNADDAMTTGGFSERISFRLTDQALTVANSGRPLSEADVRGLCGTGLTGKRAVIAGRRASIGHKGMGFKSVLEVTDCPEVFSTTVSFRLGAEASRPAIDTLMRQMQLDPLDRLPTMRLPWPVDTERPQWQEARAEGLNVMFSFPLRETLTAERRQELAKRLLAMPVTTILFLKHLDDVEVDVRTSTDVGHFRWRVTRELRRGSEWEATPGFGASGVYRVRVTGDEGTDTTFVIAHDADVEIGAHTGGLGVAGWDGIELSEVSVATPWPVGEALPKESARFHVFLPTAQASPYPLLVNGAFRSYQSHRPSLPSARRDPFIRFWAAPLPRCRPARRTSLGEASLLSPEGSPRS